MAVGRRQTLSSVSEEAQFADMTPVRRHRPDYLIVLYMGLLMMIGLVTIYAIGPQRANVLNNAYGSSYSSDYFVIKQIFSLLFALAGFLFMAFVPYTLVTKHTGKLLVAAFGACALLAVAGWADLPIAQKTLGATRWFNLGALGSLQPAELLKFAILIFVAGFLGRKYRQGKLNDINESLIPLGVITAVSMLFIVVIQKDFGTGVSLAGIIAAMLMAGGISMRNTMMIFAITALVGGILIISAPHRMDRITTFLQGDNTSFSEDSGSYQVEQAKIAIGTGGLVGLGIGKSVQSTGYLPEAINDSVFAIMGEVFGFVGLITILAIFTALLMRLLKVMDHMVDVRLKLLVAGVFGWFGTHVILNVASMIGVFPLTGITLPLLSFGGTSMVFIAAALGLVFQLSRYTVHPSRLKEAQYENISSRRGIGRARYAGRSGFTRD